MPPVCNSGFMKNVFAYAANEGIWVILGWVVIGMFVFTTALMVLGLILWIV